MIVKMMFSSIVNPLTYICNLSLAQGVFPNELKIAMCFPCIKQITHFVSITTGLYLCYVFYQRFFKRLCMTDCFIFSRSISFFVNEQFGFRESHLSYISYMALMTLTN